MRRAKPLTSVHVISTRALLRLGLDSLAARGIKGKAASAKVWLDGRKVNGEHMASMIERVTNEASARVKISA